MATNFSFLTLGYKISFFFNWELIILAGLSILNPAARPSKQWLSRRSRRRLKPQRSTPHRTPWMPPPSFTSSTTSSPSCSTCTSKSPRTFFFSIFNFFVFPSPFSFQFSVFVPFSFTQNIAGHHR